MGCFMKANKVSRYNIKMLWGNIRIPFILIIVVLYVMESLSAVSTFSQSVHINVTPFAFVFLINNYRIQFVIAACAVILFCNAPFEDESYQYMISRAGKLSWGLGQILYILKTSILYTACLAAAAVIPFLGHITWSNEWGKIWGTLGKTNAGAEFGVELSVSQNIIRQYEPAYALVISILLEFSCILCIGLLIYFLRRSEIKTRCPACGQRISVMAKYCEECGTHVEKEDNDIMVKQGTHHLRFIIAGIVSMMLMLVCLTGFIVSAAT